MYSLKGKRGEKFIHQETLKENYDQKKKEKEEDRIYSFTES